MRAIMTKWAILKMRLQHMITLKPLSVYFISMMSFETEIQNIMVLVEIMLALSVSTTVVERSVSAV